jgi:membrane-bound lytic murein transglycosylase D
MLKLLRMPMQLAVLLLLSTAVAFANDITLNALTPIPVQRALGEPNVELKLEALSDAAVEGEVDIWSRIRNGFGIPDLDNPLVENQLNWYTSRPDYIQRTTLRASRYLFHVVQELEKRNMPTELALLPFIESAFNPQALSSAKAVGMWQFMPATGADFNLRQSTFKDDRRDVLASTEAALAYLERLYRQFGDWQLALAAYNWGEGSVQRAINKNRAAGLPIDFNSLSPLMPPETRNYYPKLQAVKNIIANPELFGLSLPRVDNEPYFVAIGKMRDIDIKIAAQLAELSLDEFKALNPQFNRVIITGNANSQILLPHENASKFKENLANWGRSLSSWTSHTVTNARERIDTIASRFGTTPQVIREINNIPPNMRLRAGSTILVPKAEHAPEKDIAADLVERGQMSIEPDRPNFRSKYVKVGSKDSLASIARRNRVSVAQLKSWNNLRVDKVSTGQTLQIQIPIVLAKKSPPRAAQGPHKRPVATKKLAQPKAKVVAKSTVVAQKTSVKQQ